MLGVRKEAATVPALRGLGREVEPDAHLLDPSLHACMKTLVHASERRVSVSWVRSATQGLHSVSVEYQPDVVRIGVRLGTRPPFAGRAGCVVLRMIIEHTVVRLREPLRGRRVELMAPAQTLRRSQ